MRTMSYAGSRFKKDAETRYKPTEGEALAIAWGLRMFTLGCTDLLISTDHKPLLRIFNVRDLCSIKNPCLQDFKEATLAWRSDIAHNPGKWHKGPYLPSHCLPPLNTHTTDHEQYNEQPREERLSNLFSAAQTAVSLDDIRTEGKSDEAYSSLIKTISEGFPESRSNTPSQLRQFWEVRERLYTQDEVVYLDQSIVVPSVLRILLILEALHSANQGTSGMHRRANSIGLACEPL